MSYQLIDLLRNTTMQTQQRMKLPNVHYMYGPVMEIIEKLRTMSEDEHFASVKYPMVCVVTDIDEAKGIRPGMARVNIPTIIFACLTDPKWSTEERYDNSFRLVLQPLYESWLRQLARTNGIDVLDELSIPHTKTDRLYWGRTNVWTKSGQAVDCIDAIEVTGLELWVKKQVCNN